MTADVELLPDEVVAKFCDRMLTAAIGADWRQRAPEAVTAFWMDEVRAALQEAIAAKDAEVARWREAAEWQGAMTKELLLYQDEAVAGRAKIEALRAEMERLKRIEFCWGEWLEKTEWVSRRTSRKNLGCTARTSCACVSNRPKPAPSGWRGRCGATGTRSPSVTSRICLRMKLTTYSTQPPHRRMTMREDLREPAQCDQRALISGRWLDTS